MKKEGDQAIKIVFRLFGWRGLRSL